MLSLAKNYSEVNKMNEYNFLGPIHFHHLPCFISKAKAIIFGSSAYLAKWAGDILQPELDLVRG